MSDYTTKAVTIADITVTVSKAKSPSAGDRLEAVLEFLGDQLIDPGYGVGGQPRPDQGLPPSSGRPDQSLPPAAGTPDQSLPGEALGEFLKEHAKEIAAAILRGTACDPAQPKR